MANIMDPFVIFFIALVGAKIFGQVAKKLGQPSLLGQLFAGILLGPALLNIIYPIALLELFAEIGIFFLMFLVGMEINMGKFLKVTKSAALTAIGGVLLPLFLGYFVGQYFGYGIGESMFLGVCLSITSVALSADILMELKKLSTKLGEVLLGAAIFDNIFALLVLSAITGAITTGATSSYLTGLIFLVLKIVAFFLIAAITGYIIIPKVMRYHGLLHDRETVFTFAILLALIFGLTSRLVGLHGIVGAFLAGMFIRQALGKTKEEKILFDEFKVLSIGLFTPFFFIWLGMFFTLDVLMLVPVVAIAVILAAVIGKVAGCGIGARLSGFNLKQSLTIGIGMNGRGAIELVVAEIGRKIGILSNELFSIIVVMVLVTTIMTTTTFGALIKKFKI